MGLMQCGCTRNQITVLSSLLPPTTISMPPALLIVLILLSALDGADLPITTSPSTHPPPLASEQLNVQWHSRLTTALRHPCLRMWIPLCYPIPCQIRPGINGVGSHSFPGLFLSTQCVQASLATALSCCRGFSLVQPSRGFA
jgi:hypothetical protein